jgi:hypothetical protein
MAMQPWHHHICVKRRLCYCSPQQPWGCCWVFLHFDSVHQRRRAERLISDMQAFPYQSAHFAEAQEFSVRHGDKAFGLGDISQSPRCTASGCDYAVSGSVNRFEVHVSRSVKKGSAGTSRTMSPLRSVGNPSAFTDTTTDLRLTTIRRGPELNSTTTGIEFSGVTGKTSDSAVERQRQRIPSGVDILQNEPTLRIDLGLEDITTFQRAETDRRCFKSVASGGLSTSSSLPRTSKVDWV